METKKRIDRRKVLLICPALVIPLMASAFYAMGGGQGSVNANAQMKQVGINTSLPDATFKKEQPQDKMGFYDLADKDSMEKRSTSIESVATHLGFNPQSEEPQTREINAKLEALNKEINKPAAEPVSTYDSGIQPRTASNSNMKSDVDRLEALMKTMQENKGEDPEMQQLNGLMQSILDVQYPQRVQQKYRQDRNLSPDSVFKAIPAIIADKKKAVQGATIKLILQDSIRINGAFIPKGHSLFGACRIANQRLLLDIKQVRLGTSIIPVDLSVYSLDGMEGIEAPEAILTDAVNSGTNDAVRSIGIGSFDQSVTTQVAGAGIDAAKSLLSKKIRRIKVKLDAGKAVLLRNNQLKIR